jgi:hypothetical protein
VIDGADLGARLLPHRVVEADALPQGGLAGEGAQQALPARGAAQGHLRAAWPAGSPQEPLGGIHLGRLDPDEVAAPGQGGA